MISRRGFIGLLFAAAAGTSIRVLAQSDNVGRHNSMIREWNKLVKTENKENELLVEYQKSLQSEPPRNVNSVRRVEICNELTDENETQNKIFKKLRELEWQ